jgi:hypothetical protein
MRLRMKPRGLRALLLLPTLTVGSVAAGAFTQLPAHAASPGTIEICKSAANGMTGLSFNFTWTDHLGATGSTSVLGGQCSGPESVAGGQVTVVEAQGGATVVQAIKTLPKARLLASNLTTGTAVVKAPAGGTETVVTYTNVIPSAELKVCKQAAANSTQLVGEPFSFSINGGAATTIDAGPYGAPVCTGLTQYAAGTNVTVTELPPAAHVSVSQIAVTEPPATNVVTNLSTRTVSLTVGSGVNIVTYTNQINVSAQKGYVEICKWETDDYVYGNSFTFNIVDAAGLTYGPFTVLTGQCTGAIEVTAGPATITEAAQAPFYLDYVEVYPEANYISENDSNGTATVNVAAGDPSTETNVGFYNDTELGYVKVCKALDSANSNALAGSYFYFDWTATLSSGGTAEGTADVVANTFANGPACVFINDGEGLPIGSVVTISEEATTNVDDLTATQTVTVPGIWSPSGTPGNNITSVTFTNQAEGTIEICKDANDPETYGQPFQFTVNGGAPITVLAGECSPAIAVPAGTATVDELASTNYHEVSVTAIGPDGSNRIISGTGIAPDLNPITVSVPFGGVGNETLVTYTNAVNTGEFKICKTTSATADGSGVLLAGDTFYFGYAYTVDGVLGDGSTSLTIPTNAQAGVIVCSGILATLPVVNADGTPVTVYIDEAAFPGVHVESITYQGNGSDFTSSDAAGTSSFNIGIGVNTVTFDNEPNPPGEVGRNV